MHGDDVDCDDYPGPGGKKHPPEPSRQKRRLKGQLRGPTARANCELLLLERCGLVYTVRSSGMLTSHGKRIVVVVDIVIVVVIVIITAIVIVIVRLAILVFGRLLFRASRAPFAVAM